MPLPCICPLFGRGRRDVTCRLSLALPVLASVLLGGCQANGNGEASAAGTPEGDVLSHLRTVQVQETREVLNVTPRVTRDPWGGFLVVDRKEAQLRRYGEDGSLLWHAGRKGGGPGEFGVPSGVGRLPSGAVLVAERNGRLTLFDSAGGAVLGTVETRVGQLEDLAILSDSMVLLAGVLNGDLEGPRLHVWNLAAGTLRNSFFSPFAGQANRAAATVAGWTQASVRRDTVAAVFALSDTVYFFTLDGRAAGRIPAGFRHFRRAPHKEPDRVITDPMERARWLSAFDYVAGVHWLPDGRLLVPYQSVEPGTAMNRRWHLLALDRGGRWLFELRDVPWLLDVDGRSGEITFVERGSEVPNRWALARLRQ
ncbi:MAG: hypothetical protein KY467_03700 [Gemmatimonadetes bacterium]|nr:hypothetical protein [Gemmatimonadota bacterium]